MTARYMLMKSKITKTLSMVMATVLVCAGMVVPAAAAEDEASVGLKIDQTIESLTGAEQEQTYTVSYTNNETEQSVQEADEQTSLELEFEIPKGFNAESLEVGTWDGYEGEFEIAFSKSESEDGESTNTNSITAYPDENGLLDLTAYSDYDIFSLRTKEPCNGVIEFKDVKLNGVVSAKESGAKLATKAVYRKVKEPEDDQEEQKIFIDDASAEMTCNAYKISSMKLSSSEIGIEYLNSVTVKLNQLDISIDAGMPSDITLEITAPDSIIIDKLTMPELKNATYKIYANDIEQRSTDGVYYISSKIDAINIVIYPEDHNLTNISGIELTARSTLNANASANINCRATLHNGLGDNVDSNSASCSFRLYQVKKKDSSSSSGTTSYSVGSTGSKKTSSTNNSSETATENNGEKTEEQSQAENNTESKTTTSSSGSSNTASSSANEAAGAGEEEDEEEVEVEEEATVVDYSGLNLMSAKATQNSINTIIHDDQTQSTGLSTVFDEKVQTTDVYDLTTVDDSESTDEAEDSDQLTSVSGHEYANDAAGSGTSLYDDSMNDADNKSTGIVSMLAENRMFPFAVAIIIVLIAVIIGVVIAYRRSHSQSTAPEDESEDTENEDAEPDAESHGPEDQTDSDEDAQKDSDQESSGDSNESIKGEDMDH